MSFGMTRPVCKKGRDYFVLRKIHQCMATKVSKFMWREHFRRNQALKHNIVTVMTHVSLDSTCKGWYIRFAIVTLTRLEPNAQKHFIEHI